MMRLKQNEKGITLIELMIVSLIIGIITMGVASLYISSAETTMMVQQRSDATFTAQEGVERMVDLVRNSDGLLEIGPDEFALNERGEKTVFTYNSEKQTLLKDGNAYATGVTAFTPSYYDADGNPTTDAASVVKVEFDITAKSKDEEKSLDTFVIIRRLV
ncbi:MAG: prepilin-type N-terminal cleavage/methylation domain-containing protein [bacterium]|jgi:prepilin-type N-terminal cleavage/methylation domain-containing protein